MQEKANNKFIMIKNGKNGLLFFIKKYIIILEKEQGAFLYFSDF